MGILSFEWYFFQNSSTVRDIDLKFRMVIDHGKLMDSVHIFLHDIFYFVEILLFSYYIQLRW
jgi:hypothetical protein